MTGPVRGRKRPRPSEQEKPPRRALWTTLALIGCFLAAVALILFLMRPTSANSEPANYEPSSQATLQAGGPLL